MRHLSVERFGDVEWVPLELRTPDRPVLDPADPAWAALTSDMASEAHTLEIPFREPTFIPHTRKAHELALHAAETDPSLPIHRALFRAHFLEGRDLGRIDHLVAIAESLGLEAAEVRTVLGVDRYLPAIRSLRSSVLEEDVRGTPTLVRGDQRLEGYRGERELQIFLSRIGLH